MNRKTTIVSVLLAVLLIGIVSATLITSWGTITGSVEVKAPVFYLDGHIGGVYYNLFTNEIPSEEVEVNWNDGETIKFKTSPLGVDSFYETKFNFIFYAKTDQSGSKIQMRVTKLDDDGSKGDEICISGTKEITATQIYSNYELICTSPGEINLEEYQGFVLEVFGLSENETDQYWLSTGNQESGERKYGASNQYSPLSNPISVVFISVLYIPVISLSSIFTHSLL